ncbi:MAG: type IV conjugative transfer system protein TraL [Thiotrichales bacterium]|nr:type IV conjugative transfer system protein TraL [Thiotrichales bacterium]
MDAPYVIPRRLDDPERWLFWTLDEAAALLAPAVLGLGANAFLAGLGAGVGAWLLLRRVKRGGGAHVALYALYWMLPGPALGLKATPPSHLRRFAG